jgi:hypothetical protein
LDLLDFIRPNPDFSMGYGEKNKKIPVFSVRRQAACTPRASPARGRRYSTGSDFRKEIA